MAEEDMMGERPPMPDMAGANMNQGGAMDAMPKEAQRKLMEPDPEIGTVLMARLSMMSPEELRMLDSAISPQVAQILMKLLPELGALIAEVEKMGAGDQTMPRDQMGALGRM